MHQPFGDPYETILSIVQYIYLFVIPHLENQWSVPSLCDNNKLTDIPEFKDKMCALITTYILCIMYMGLLVRMTSK